MSLIRFENPPNIEALRAVFPITESVVFAYYPHIFVPNGKPIDRQIIAHEMVHLDRQARHKDGVVGWWLDYIKDPEFRLMEEIPAHYAEWRYMLTAEPSRASRRKNLAIIAKKLSSPLYGNLVTLETAKSILEMGPEGAQERAKAWIDEAPDGNSGNQGGGE